MNITRLRLHDFRRHADLDIELVPGLNVIRGPNEAGKSTIQRAIEMALFRRPTSTAAEMDDVRAWGTTQGQPTVELEFEDEGQRGSLKKVFAGQGGTVEMVWGGETLNDPGRVDQQVAALTGLLSEKFLRATASINHQDLARLDKDEGTLRDRLQQSISGADRGTRAARKKLQDAIWRYRTEGAKNPGYLKVQRADVDRLTDQLRQGESALEQLEADRRSLAEARAERARLDAELAEQADGLARAERAVALKSQAAEATRQYDKYRQAAELSDQIAALEASHPSPVPLARLKAIVDHLRNLEFSLSEMRAELAAEPDLSAFDVALPSPRWRPWLFAAAALLLFALVALGAGIVAGAAVLGVIVGAVLLAAAGFAFFTSYRERTRISDIRVQNEMREAEIARRLAGRSQLSEKLRQTEQERAELLAPVKLGDLASVEALHQSESDHQALIDNKRSELRGVLGSGSDAEVEPATIVAERDRAAAEADQCRHALAGMGDIGADPDRLLGVYRLAVQRLTPERETAIQTEAQAEARVEANATDAEQVAATAEGLEVARETLDAAERRLRIYEEALSSLDNAEQATMRKAARFLEKTMAKDVERLTDGRYKRLKIDEATLTFRVYSPELADWVDVRLLSQGTLDQLYLCARLGIVRQITQPALPPLIFDDAFVSFDPERAERAIELLKQVAADLQVIYLTCSDRYDALADKVIELPVPTGRDDGHEIDEPVVDEAAMAWHVALEQANRHVAGALRGQATQPTPEAAEGSDDASPSVTPFWPTEDR